MLAPTHVPDDAQRFTEATNIFGVPISVCTLIEGIGLIAKMIDNGTPQLVVLANVHTLNLAYEQSEYKKVLMEAGLVLRDGAGIRWALGKKSVNALHNFVGTDFIPAFCKYTANKGYRIFFLGSESGVAEDAANKLASLAPGVVIAGVHHGYFIENETVEIIRRINKTRSDMLLVAMGNPKQELWIAKNLHRLDVPVCIGVGALFDYLSERVTRGPQWMLNAGTEWVFRLLTEPKRLWKRYLIGNPKFIIRVCRENAGHEKRSIA